MQLKIHSRIRTRKYLLLFSLVSVLSFHQMDAQTLLDSFHSIPRKGDCLVKQQMVYKDPGEVGSQMLLDISELPLVNERYELKYSTFDGKVDRIVGTEHSTMYYYYLCGDSLLSFGYENPTTLMKYRKSETLLIFPFSYGHTFTDYFDGIGSYCNQIDIHVQGKSTVTADAVGMMILPGGDTLQHVLRVYTQKEFVEKMHSITRKDSRFTGKSLFTLNRDSIDWHLAHDSVHIRMAMWRWYVEGYRYPVFESIRSAVCDSDTCQEYLAVSFYYPPHEQYYRLEDDLENRLRREHAAVLENNFQNFQPDKNGNTRKNTLISYDYQFDSHGDLLLRYTLVQDADVTIILYDLQGRQLTTSQVFTQFAGSYNKIISLYDHPSGEKIIKN